MSNIIISGARKGKLKNVLLEISGNNLVVFTGLSGFNQLVTIDPPKQNDNQFI